jgi:lipopolysaccharide transport protein LptA
MTTRLFKTSCVLGFFTTLASMSVMALPEDADQPILFEYDNSELLLDEGVEILYGSENSPAKVIQGTLLISGTEITIRRVDGDIKQIRVKGHPAHFQQQPAANQPPAIAEGLTLILNRESQHVSIYGDIEGDVMFSQGNDKWTGCHIDYYLETRRLVTREIEGCRSSAVIAPRNNQ